MSESMNKPLRFLCEKYSTAYGEIQLDSGKPQLKLADGTIVPLLPWRVERRFVELKNLIVNRTLEDVSTLRFSSLSAGGCLKKQIAKELDLAVWMTGSPVKSVFAVCNGTSAANLVVKLANDMNVSIECSNKLPAGSEFMDRHEIIARRGIASDRAVDTQVPQSSIYVYGQAGETRYTDTDSELFGFSDEAIWTIRAAFAVLAKNDLVSEWIQAAAAMEQYADGALKSDSTQKAVCF